MKRKSVSIVLFRWLLLASLIVAALPTLQVSVLVPAASAAPQSRPAQATTNALTLNVLSARTESRAFGGAGVAQGAAVTNFKYIINIDNTGTTVQRSVAPGSGCSPADPGYPGSCAWVSIAGAASNSPIYTQGDQSDFANGGLVLPDGRYLISVIADGYKLDGAHFTVPLEVPGLVTVELQPFPLPEATIRAWVFEDVSPTNSGPDAPAEHGLAGFQGHIADYIGEVTTDIYGNPLCTRYEGEDPNTFAIPASALDADGLPVPVPGTGGKCLSDATGMLAIPHVGPNRYALSAVPPDGSDWIQTTTLEGNHDWDAWVMEGATGYDTEFVVAGEPFPAAFFGFVRPTNTLSGGAGQIKGVVAAFKTYVPVKGGVIGGEPMVGSKVDHAIAGPWISLADLQAGDTAVWIGQGNADGSFTILNVPNGNYMLAYWDEPQDYILNIVNVTVANGEVVDLGVMPLSGWWAQYEGYVFSDDNRNGKMDWQDLNGNGCPDGGVEGEKGLANFPIVMKKRENSQMDRGWVGGTTDGCGRYFMENAYPMTQWLVMEAYSDLFYTTGVTFQADNQPAPTTVIGQGVDVSVLPIIGLGGRLDWGVHSYDPTGANGIDPRNGGIVGSVSYDTTRNELDPRFAAVEAWQPGIPNLNVNLYAPVLCNTHPGTPCDATRRYELAPDGSFAKGKLLNTYVTETWERPKSCVARDVNGNPLVHGVDEQVLPTDPNADCLEGPLMGIQFAPYATDQGTPDANFGAAVDGNYGFGDACFNGTLDATDPAAPVCVGGTFEPLAAGDYLVQVEAPNDALGRQLYKVTKEEDINIFNGDQFVPQIPPPECAGALHTVDVANSGQDNYPAVTLPNGITVPASTPVDNQPFADGGGTVYEGQQKPLCDVKLVRVSNGRSVAPGFNFFTDVPVPGRFWGLIVDDLNFSSNPQSLLYGEKAGVPFAPVGVYDWSNRLITTVESDYNGLFDVLLPSSNRINCPTPSGVCANLYRLVGNDPGIPGRLNSNYNPQFRTIAADFESIPGLIVPADLAPTQVGVTAQLPGTQFNQPVACTLPADTPQLFAVSQPYVDLRPGLDVTITIKGQGFGAQGAASRVTLDGSTMLPVVAWTNIQITVTVPASLPGNFGGPHQLDITAANGQRTVKGLTFHVGKGNYNPVIYLVGPGRTYATIQSALDQSALDAANTNNYRGGLVIVYPGATDPANPRYNPRGAYYENIIINSPVKLQGVGPGGVYTDNTVVPGSIIDGSAFGGDTALADAWRAKVAGLTWVGNQTVSEGQAIYLLARSTTQFGSAFKASIDGLDIRGGDQQGQANILTQGGAIFANAYIRNLQITNNLIEGNSSSYGTVRIGTPDLPAPNTSQHNEDLRIANNRIFANAGTNLAGGIALYAGADRYEVANNDICGNFSAEYGGGMTAYGFSPNGKIHDNRIYYNQSYDEGGGIMIAGQLPASPLLLSPGSGSVSIYNNLIQGNMSNDDGGGLRFLMAGNFPMTVTNNIIVNNISTHEGGGISLNDAPNVRVYNNTIIKNLTTATALTSNGFPAPAGLSTSANSDLLQATLPAGSPLFSNPLLFNNIFWDNRAGTRGQGTVTGLGAAGDPTPINYWDLGVADGTGTLAPTNSIIQAGDGAGAPTNIGADPAVSAMYDTGVAFAPWRTNINFVGAIMVTADVPPTLAGNYHLSGAGSPAYNTGAAAKSGVSAPAFDIDNELRPAFGGYDIGADEIPQVTDLSIAKSDGQTAVASGSQVTYTIVAANAGPATASDIAVMDNVPTILTGVTWTCTASAGSSCGAASGSGNSLNTTVSLLARGSVTFTVVGTVNPAVTSGSLVNTVTIIPPAGAADPVASNNSATDTDTIYLPLPSLGVLDNFNRANVNNLGSNWSPGSGTQAIRINTNQAFAFAAGQAIWNVPTTGFGARQGTAFTFANAPLNGSALFLKATGGTSTTPANLIRVRYNAGQVIVETTTDSGSSYTQRGTLAATFASGNTLTAVANADGSVDVWRNATYLGRVMGTTFTGTGRIGIQLPANARIDDLRGGTLP